MSIWRPGLLAWETLLVVLTLSGLFGSRNPELSTTPADEPVLCTPGGITTGVQTEATQGATGDALPFRAYGPELTRATDDVEAPSPSPQLMALQERLAGIVQDSPQAGRFAVAVTDLQTGETIGVGLDRVQLSGCVTNLFAIIAALRDVDAGRYPLSDVDADIRQTIWASDATTARKLYRKVGGGNVVEGVRTVSALLHETLQMSSSIIDHPPAFPDDAIGAGPNNLVTARDVNHALSLVYSGDVLSAELTSYLLEAMTQVKPGLNYLTGVVAPPGLVSHKNGFFWDPEGWVDNDTSIVRFGPALEHAYALTFLSEAVPTLYADIPLGQKLVLETWEYFRSAYE